MSVVIGEQKLKAFGVTTKRKSERARNLLWSVGETNRKLFCSSKFGQVSLWVEKKLKKKKESA